MWHQIVGCDFTPHIALFSQSLSPYVKTSFAVQIDKGIDQVVSKTARETWHNYGRLDERMMIKMTKETRVS